MHAHDWGTGCIQAAGSCSGFTCDGVATWKPLCWPLPRELYDCVGLHSWKLSRQISSPVSAFIESPASAHLGAVLHLMLHTAPKSPHDCTRPCRTLKPSTDSWAPSGLGPAARSGWSPRPGGGRLCPPKMSRALHLSFLGPVFWHSRQWRSKALLLLQHTQLGCRMFDSELLLPQETAGAVARGLYSEPSSAALTASSPAANDKLEVRAALDQEAFRLQHLQLFMSSRS